MSAVVPYLATLRHYLTGQADEALYIAHTAGGDLTVPIDGGRSRRNRQTPAEWMISEHGRWRQIHMRTLEVTYGRAPFWRHYAPALEEVIADTSEHSFASMTRRIDALVHRWLNSERILPRLTPRHTPEYVLGIDDIDYSLSMMHYLLAYGPDAVFLLNTCQPLRTDIH